MLTMTLIIYLVLYLTLAIIFKIAPSKTIYPLYAIPEKYRKPIIFLFGLIFLFSFFVDGMTAPFVFGCLSTSYIIEFIQLKKHKARYYSALNSTLFIVLLVVTLFK